MGRIRQTELHWQIAFADVGRGVKTTQQLRRSSPAIYLDLSPGHAEDAAASCDELHGSETDGHFVAPITNKVPAAENI